MQLYAIKLLNFKEMKWLINVLFIFVVMKLYELILNI